MPLVCESSWVRVTAPMPGAIAATSSGKIAATVVSQPSLPLSTSIAASSAVVDRDRDVRRHAACADRPGGHDPPLLHHRCGQCRQLVFGGEGFETGGQCRKGGGWLCQAGGRRRRREHR